MTNAIVMGHSCSALRGSLTPSKGPTEGLWRGRKTFGQHAAGSKTRADRGSAHRGKDPRRAAFGHFTVTGRGREDHCFSIA